MPGEMAENAPQLPSERLRRTGPRPTRQRVALAEFPFGGGDRHFTVEMAHAEAVCNGVHVSRAALNFRKAGRADFEGYAGRG